MDEAKDAEDKILCLLDYRNYHSDGAATLSEKEIKESILINRNIVFETAFGNLTDPIYNYDNPTDSFISQKSEQGRVRYSISFPGTRYVNGWSDEKYQRIAEGISFSGDEVVGVPAADRTVTLNHNQPDYQETVAALDKVLQEFRDDHRLDNELGQEKRAWLKALEAGRELFNDTILKVRIATTLILEPLRWLVEKYDSALVGAAASTALTLMIELLKKAV
ncbi:MAG TPA: hypothetical protein VK558_03765 [Patescibacteria group bacterium]|nr:hypothetical protein [Patescibacteria group bacterium]